MSTSADRLLCHYHYDPLDRLNGCSPANQEKLQRFYWKTRLTTETHGQVQISVFKHGNHVLAQLSRQGTGADVSLLATDKQSTVLHTLDVQGPQPLAYTPYGHHPTQSGLNSLLGFNGERRDPVTGHYLLGNGYRAFNPVLMRFNSPDRLSPFAKGGLNAYGYCVGDPINRVDPTGHISGHISWSASRTRLRNAGATKMTVGTSRINASPSETSIPVFRFIDESILKNPGVSAAFADQVIDNPALFSSLPWEQQRSAVARDVITRRDEYLAKFRPSWPPKNSKLKFITNELNIAEQSYYDLLDATYVINADNVHYRVNKPRLLYLEEKISYLEASYRKKATLPDYEESFPPTYEESLPPTYESVFSPAPRRSRVMGALEKFRNHLRRE